MKQTLLTMLSLLLAVIGVQAQVISSYSLVSSSGTYEELTGATVINTAALEGDELDSKVFGADGTAVSSSSDVAGIDIGFPFSYNQQEMTKFVIYTNGAIQLGTGDITVNPSGFYNNFSNASNFLGICGIRDITNSADTEISYKVVGEAPNRELVVQWKNAVSKMAYWGDGSIIKNQQIRLSEADGKITFVFGTWTPSEEMNSANFKIGLGGVNEDFLLLTGTYSETTSDYKESSAAIWTTTDNYPSNGLTYTFTPPAPCVAPTAQPTDLVIEAASSSISGSFTPTESADHYLVLYSTQPINASPADGVSYAAGDEIDGAKALLYTDGTTFDIEGGLTGSTTYYFAIYAANSRCLNGPTYLLASPLTGEVQTMPGAPGALTAEVTDLTTIKLTAAANASGQKVIIAQTDKAAVNDYDQMLEVGAFGKPTGALSVGDEIEGGGIVIFAGIPNECITIEGLKENSAYFFRAWSVDDNNNYSSDVTDTSTATGGTVPYTPDFSQFSPYNYDYVPGWETEGEFCIQEDQEGTKYLQINVSNPDTDLGTKVYATTPWVQLAEGTNRISFDLNMVSPGWWSSPYAWNMDDEFKVLVSEDGENYTTILNVNDSNAPKFDEGNVNYTVVFTEGAGKKVKIRLQFNIFSKMEAKFYNFTVEEKKAVDYPIELAAAEIVGNKATIVWKSQNDPAETNWELRYKKTEDSEWGEPIAVANEPKYELTDLIGLCEYDVQVRAISGEQISDWSKTLQFTSGISIPFEDTFSNGNVAGWTSMTGKLQAEGTVLEESGAWKYNSRNGMMFSTYMSEVNEWLISPTLDLGSGDKSYSINFDMANIYGSNDGANITYQIVISKDNGETWSANNVLATYTGDAIPNTPVESTVYSADLSDYTGNVKVGFYISAVSEDIDYLRINKISVLENEKAGTSFNVTYAVQEGDTHASGEVVSVTADGKEVATLTFGEEGGADFKAGKASSAVDGYVAFTEGNGTNGNKAGGTFYIIAPKYDGHISAAVVLNSEKSFFIEEDGTALPDYNGITVESKYNGTFEFDVTGGKKYKLYCAGSKLGFYGFNYTGTMEPEDDPIYIDIDVTTQFDALTEYTNWIGATGYATWAAPQVQTNSGKTLYMCEKYEENCESTGDVFYQNIIGLTPGRYTIELYGSGAYTFGRGFNSGYFRPEDTAEDPITSNTGLSLYAETANGSVSQEIAVYKATSFSEVSTAVLENVTVGVDGALKLGMNKTSNYTNWHIVQLKGVTAFVNASEYWASLALEANELLNEKMNSDVSAELLNAIVDESGLNTAEDYKAAIATLTKAMEKAKESVAYYKLIKELLDTYAAKAADLDNDGRKAYDVTDIQKAYEDGTISQDSTDYAALIKDAYVKAVKSQTRPGSNYTDAGSTAQADWIGSTGVYQDIYAERFGEEMGEGEIMYQKIEGLKPGYYNVTLNAVASQAWNNAAVGNDITVAYANDATYGIEVIAQTACDPEQSIVSLDARVRDDGVLQFGMKNLTNGGNWFVVQLKSITLTELKKEGIYIDIDVTNQFDALTEYTNWIGATGYATWAAPQVQTNSGKTLYMCEKYEENCESTGDVFYQNINGLTPGRYTIELYGSGAYTFGRGFNSGYFRPEDTAEDPLTSNTGLSLYAETAKGTVSQEIAVYKATSFSEVSTAVLENVTVGEDGTMKLGMNKTSNYTNWHIVQLKGVTAIVNASEYWLSLFIEAYKLLNEKMDSDASAELLYAIVDESGLNTAEDYKAAIANLIKAMEKAKESVAYYKQIKELLDTYAAKAATLDQDGQNAYDVTDIQKLYTYGYLKDSIDYAALIKDAYVKAVKAQTTPGSNYTDAGSTAQADWIGSTGVYQTIYAERFGEEMGEGEIMYQKIEGLQPGTYNVQMNAVASQAWNDAAVGNDITVAYANDATYGIEVIAQTACDPEQSIVSLDATVGEDGILQFGMKNLTNGGNWFVVQLKSITLTLLEKDAIEAIENKNRLNGTVYNLNGQKVNNPSRGIYIINGKKVVVK